MNVPSKLLAFKLFADGFGFAGIADATKPTISETEADIRPGGSVGTFAVALGLEKAELALI
mgnify:CR=1 FL=1